MGEERRSRYKGNGNIILDRVIVSSETDCQRERNHGNTITMHLSIVITLLATLSVAVPFPQDRDDPMLDDTEDDESSGSSGSGLVNPTTTVPATTSLNIPVTGLPIVTRSKHPHWEPIPIFTKACQCSLATAQYPCWATDALQVLFEALVSFFLFYEAPFFCMFVCIFFYRDTIISLLYWTM